MDLSEIAVVILNWNGRKLLEQFLPNVVKFSGNATIYLADNASSDDSVSFTKSHFPTVKIIQNKENGGFAKGYNDALKNVNEPYFLLLNSDIEVTENWLVPLLGTIKDEKVGAVQPKIRAFHQKDSFEYAGACGGFIDRNFYPFCRGRIFDTVEKDEAQYDYPMDIFWTSGACMLVKKEWYWKAGGLDEDFFAHMEEIDLCWRIKKLGFTLKVQPSSHVFHVGGGTLSYNSPRKVYLNFRNSLYMILKNYEGNYLFKLFQRMVLDGIAGAKFLVSGHPKLLLSVLKAHFSLYKNFRRMKAKRTTTKVATKNMSGFYNASILWDYHFKKNKLFSALNLRRMK